MKKNLTPRRRVRSFDEYWKQRHDPSAVTAWEEALIECEVSFRQEWEELIISLDIVTTELLNKDPGNDMGKIVRETWDLDRHLEEPDHD